LNPAPELFDSKNIRKEKDTEKERGAIEEGNFSTGILK